MFALPTLLVLIGIFTTIQIGVWQMLPVSLKDIIFSNPILAFIVNLAGSSFILMFTGVASMVGVANLGASVLFGLYAIIYKKAKGIEGLEIGWRFLKPKIVVKYKRRTI